MTLYAVRNASTMRLVRHQRTLRALTYPTSHRANQHAKRLNEMAGRDLYEVFPMAEVKPCRLEWEPSAQ